MEPVTSGLLFISVIGRIVSCKMLILRPHPQYLREQLVWRGVFKGAVKLKRDC